jgi:Tol biopolymer transport system component
MLSRLAVVGLAAAIALSCEPPFGPQTKGALRITIATTGGDLDLDGYGLRVDADPEVALDLNAATVIVPLDTGNHHVELDGVAGNCSVGGGASRTVRVTLADTASVAFAVGCVATGVEVTAATVGIDVDPDGYTVSVNGAPPVAVPVNGTVSITRLTPGSHTVDLGGIVANCPVGGTASRTLTLNAGEVAQVGFALTCLSATGIVEVKSATTGLDLDPDGYTVQLDGGTPQAVGPSGTVRFIGVSGGDHQLSLGGVAGNCPVAGSNPRTVTVTTGVARRDTARTTFSVTCGAATGRIEVTAATTGLDLDPDGYTVQVDGGSPQPLAVNGTVGFSGVSGGDHSITLGAAAGNCSVGGSNARAVTVTTGGATRDTVRTTFGVNCLAATASIEVTAATSGSDLDANGYLVRVDNRAPVAAPANGAATVNGLGAGSHSILLDGVAGNCVIGGANPRVLAVTTGATTRDTARTTYTLTCAATTGSVAVTVATSGVDPDTNGYTVRVQASGVDTAVVLGSNVTTTIAKLLPGDYTVRLEGVAQNCDPVGQIPRPVRVAVGQSAPLAFAVACLEAPQLAFTSWVNGNTDIYVVKSNGAGLTRLTTAPGDDVEPAWSPGGAKIGFASQRDGNSEIYVMDANGANQVRLTTAGGADYHPTWSKDGSKIAFVSERDGNAEIYVMDASGANQVRLTNDFGIDADPAWSPDGQKVAFRSSRGGGGYSQIYVMNADGTGVTRLTNESINDIQPAWSPDGARIVFARDYGCDDPYYGCYADLITMAANGSSVSPLLEGGAARGPAWSPDGRLIAFMVSSCDYYTCYSQIQVMRADGTDPIAVVGDNAFNPAWRR